MTPVPFQFARLFTPHDDVPRWPLVEWTEALVAAIQRSSIYVDTRRLATCLNNAALVALHCRDRDCARALCLGQLQCLQRRLGASLDQSAVLTAMVQPLINLMRLEFRGGTPEVAVPANWSEPQALLRLTDMALDTAAAVALAAAIETGLLRELINLCFAREIAMALVTGPTKWTWRDYQSMRLPETVPPSAVFSLQAETDLITDPSNYRVVRHLHPFASLVYLPACAERLRNDQCDAVAYALVFAISRLPCSRYGGELLCETCLWLTRLGRPISPDTFNTLDYLQGVGDQLLLARYRASVLCDGCEDGTASGYGGTSRSAEIRQEAAGMIRGIRVEVEQHLKST